MKISIIITTYNSPHMLKKVLDGLIHQTVAPHEVIIADDGSTLKTAELLNNYASHALGCPMIHVWHEDRGFRAAEIRNRALRNSSGDYVIFLDGDCIPGAHFVADHKILAKQGFFFQGKRILIERDYAEAFTFEDTLNTAALIWETVRGRISNAHHLLRFPFFPVFTNVKMSGTRSCNLGVFREDLQRVNGFNEQFIGWGGEDSELVARFYNLGLKRREHPFMAICYHLWHCDNSREHLDRNDKILKDAMDSNDYYCRQGLSR